MPELRQPIIVGQCVADGHVRLLRGHSGSWVTPSGPGYPILAVLRLKGQPKRDGSIIVRSCKASQSPVYPTRDAFAVVEHPSCPSSSSSCPLPVG